MKKRIGELASKGETPEPKEKPEDWTSEEVRAAIASYFAMLSLEARQQRYNKAKFNSELRQNLRNRSKGSVEYKHQNISAVLMAMGLPFINGYKPHSNIQQLLRQEVEGYIDNHHAEVEGVVDAMQDVPELGQQAFKGVLADAPATTPAPHPELNKVRSRLPRKIDYAARDESNRQLGRAGEQWVLAYERQRLRDEGFPELAEKVDWVSDRCGDGLGYDILSFDASGKERYIEVKTTNGQYTTPFVISRNELYFSCEFDSKFYLYRVFQYRQSPRLYILSGDLSLTMSLEATNYKVSFRS